MFNINNTHISFTNLISSFIETNFNDYDKSHNIIGLDVKVWIVGKYVIRHSRMIRGDIIEVYEYHNDINYELYPSNINDILLFSYVDQSYAYKGLLGINDIININLEYEDFEMEMRNYCTKKTLN